MRFTKMHGQGNDFVVVGGAELPAGTDLPALSIFVCDRHKGVGADGLITVTESENCDFLMRIFNPDGSEPEMCGNGVRCAAKFFLEKTPPENLALTDDGRAAISVETLAGVRNIVADYSGGIVGGMTVDMGAPILAPRDIPVLSDAMNAVGVKLTAAGADLTVTCVSMGNPHAVIFVDDDPFAMDISKTGPAVENHEIFPKRTNVEFVKALGPGELVMRVWERGVGETQACGTGACATLVAAVLNGVASRSAVIHLAGGDLRIDWKESGEVLMTGPAVTVFEGTLEVAR